jgi:PAS domain S-box-containing protein
MTISHSNDERLRGAHSSPGGDEWNRVQLKEVSAQAPAGVAFLSGPKHQFCYANDLYVRAVGRSRADDLIGMPFPEVLPELKSSGVFDILDQVYRKDEADRGGEPRVTIQLPNPEKSESQYFDFTFHPVCTSTGQVDGIFVLAVDSTDRELSRHAVELSEERLLMAQEAAQIGSWEWDPADDSCALSLGMHRMYGTDPDSSDERVYRLWSSRVFPADWPQVSRAMAECQRTGVLDLEYRYDHPEMGLRHHHSKGRRMGTSKFFGVVSDITNRKRGEEASAGREEQFRSLADAMPQLVWMADADGSPRWFNERWYEYTGTTAEQNCGSGWQSVHDPKFLPEVVEQWKHSLGTGEAFEMVFPLRGKDGVYRPFLTRAVPMRDAGGKINRWFGTNTDISGEFKIRQQIEASQFKLQTALDASQRLAAIVESSDDAIIGKDLNGVVTSWNPCAERVFGFTAEEMIGNSIRTIVPAEVFPDEDRIMSAVARGERTEHFETVRMTKDGERIEVSLTLSPVFNEVGAIVGVASISRDISQQKKVEKALHTSERLATVGKLAATIAHEINNPLEAVTNLVFLAQGNMKNEEGKVFLEQAQQELARMALLTKQTLGFYRENKGARLLTLGELVTPLVSVFSARARNKQISIETDIRENPTLMGIPGEIRQLFANLLNNSIDAVSDRGRILIRLSAGNQYKGRKRPGVRLTVCDNGPGIAPEVRKKLFEPFFTTKRDVGTGLGLWVSSNILRKHDGSIRLRSSVVPGKSWTVFSVFFPIESNLPAATSG